MSRSKRFLGGLSLSYFYQAATLLAGLWITPFLIGHLGKHDFGLWQLGLQTIAYLSLMDLGIVALLPREVAYATGRALGDGAPPDLKRIIGEAGRVVLLQTPFVAAFAAMLWLSAPPAWAQLRPALAVIMGVFVLTFPARVFTATLDGLQDLSYLGKAQIATWAANMAVMILLVSQGWGLKALAAGWAVLQAAPAVAAYIRLRRKFPDALPDRLPPMSLRAAANYFRRTIWLSVAQFAQSFLSNTDFMILGYVAGPEAAVVYSCTGKLVSALANQPQLLMAVASPAICELRATGDKRRLLFVAICLTRLMMMASGLVACLVLAANERFVAWWVPTVKFGGPALTALLAAAMLLRHLNVTTVTTLVCFAQEKRISLTTLSDGIVTVICCLAGIHYWGLAGAAFGSLIGVMLVSLPLNFSGLAEATGVSPWLILRSLWPWFWRFAVATAIGQAVKMSGAMATLPGFFAACAGIALIYGLLMLPLMFQEPLAEYTRPLLARLTARRAVTA